MTDPPVVGHFDGVEIYPMPIFATLSVPDAGALSDWYQAALGFSVVFAAPPAGGQPSLVHLRRRKYQDLLIVPGPPGPADAGSTLTLSFEAGGDVDELAQRARTAPPTGVASIEGPVATPWNTRDLRVTDPAGHRLVFFERDPNPDPEQAARMKALIEAGRKS